MTSFRRSLAFVILALSFSCPGSAQTLRQAADKEGLLLGTAVRPSQLSEHGYAFTLAREFNMVEAEDAMKWWVLRPDEDKVYHFRQGDDVVRFAQANGMKVRFIARSGDVTIPLGSNTVASHRSGSRSFCTRTSKR